MQPNVEFIVASDAESRDAIYRFRQTVAEGSRAPLNMLPSDYQIRSGAGVQDLLDPFAITAAAIDRSTNAIVGAVRTNYLRESSVPVYPEMYGLRDLPCAAIGVSSITTCWTMAAPLSLASSRELTSPAVGLAWTLYDVALKQRICHDYLDCADEDVPFFTHLGYRFVREGVHPVRGRCNVMRLDIYDWSYLAEIKSPFLSLARGVA